MVYFVNMNVGMLCIKGSENMSKSRDSDHIDDMVEWG